MLGHMKVKNIENDCHHIYNFCSDVHEKLNGLEVKVADTFSDKIHNTELEFFQKPIRIHNKKFEEISKPIRKKITTIKGKLDSVRSSQKAVQAEKRDRMLQVAVGVALCVIGVFTAIGALLLPPAMLIPALGMIAAACIVSGAFTSLREILRGLKDQKGVDRKLEELKELQNELQSTYDNLKQTLPEILANYEEPNSTEVDPNLKQQRKETLQKYINENM